MAIESDKDGMSPLVQETCIFLEGITIMEDLPVGRVWCDPT